MDILRFFNKGFEFAVSLTIRVVLMMLAPDRLKNVPGRQLPGTFSENAIRKYQITTYNF